MSIARQKFLEAMDGAYFASQHRLLLDPAGASHDEVQAARLLRNGLAVTSFAAFEGFVRERTAEIAAWLTSQSVPFSVYPAGLQSAPLHRGVSFLSASLKRDPSSPEVQQAIVELGEAWSRMGTGGGWRLPHAALMWPGSNLSAGEALSILDSFGVASNWQDIAGVAEAAGFSRLPTKQLFDEIAGRRNDSAHNASYDADILLLRATPAHLTAFAFALDVLISHAARAIARHDAVKKGRASMSLTRLDQDQSGTAWEQHAGPVSIKNPTSPTLTHSSDLQSAVAACSSSLSSTTDILLVRKWNGIEHLPLTWYTVGV